MNIASVRLMVELMLVSAQARPEQAVTISVAQLETILTVLQNNEQQTREAYSRGRQAGYNERASQEVDMRLERGDTWPGHGEMGG